MGPYGLCLHCFLLLHAVSPGCTCNHECQCSGLHGTGVCKSQKLWAASAWVIVCSLILVQTKRAPVFVSLGCTNQTVLVCRVCSQHGQALTALNLYEWMRSSKQESGAALRPTVYTYTAAMRAALNGNMVDRALKVCHQQWMFHRPHAMRDASRCCMNYAEAVTDWSC